MRGASRAVAPAGRRLLLVGAGHAHLYLLARAAELTAAGYDVALLSPEEFAYSGVAAATAVGALPRRTGVVDVAALAGAGPVRHHCGTLVDLDLTAGTATSSGGESVDFDVISLNIGSVVDPPGVALDDRVVKVKPLAELAALDDRLGALPPVATVTVVGAGPSGIELAAQISLRPEGLTVRLIEAGPQIAPSLPAGARLRLVRLLSQRNIEICLNAPVELIAKDHVVLRNGTTLAHDLAVLATGLAAPAVIARVGIGDRSGIPVLDTLVHPDHDHLYATGDCARFLPRPLPRVGVHGVRQGPVLLRSLLARAEGRRLPRYRPRNRVLSIVDLGGGIALSVWGPLWWLGTTSEKLKRRIDARWLQRYQTQQGESGR